MKKIKSINIDEDVWLKFRVHCVKNNLKVGDALVDLINTYLKKGGK